MFYGSNVWDPVLIIAQIVSVQCLFYLSLGLIQAVTIGPTLGYITVGYIFDWGTLHFKTKLGWLNWLSHLANSLAAAAALAWIVERAKKCLDFAATCYIWHLLFVACYSGWPASGPWWLANGVGAVVMVLLGEWLCVQRELQDIPLSLHKWGSRKESGIMLPLPSEDPDHLPPRPRLRTAAAAAAAAAAGSTSGRPPAASAVHSGGGGSGGSGIGLATAVAAAAAAGGSGNGGSVPRPASGGLALQMAALGGGGSTRDTIGAGQRKKGSLSRAGSSSNIAASSSSAASSGPASAGGAGPLKPLSVADARESTGL